MTGPDRPATRRLLRCLHRPGSYFFAWIDVSSGGTLIVTYQSSDKGRGNAASAFFTRSSATFFTALDMSIDPFSVPDLGWD